MNQSKNHAFSNKKLVSIQKKLVGRNARYMITMALSMFIMIFVAVAVLSQNILRLTMQQVAVNASYNLTNQFYIYTLCMNGISDNPYFKNTSLYRDEVIDRLEKKTEAYWAFTSFVDLDGEDYRTGENHLYSEFFNRALEGGTYISSPVQTNDGLFYIVSTAAYYEDTLIGVFYMLSDYNYIYSIATETAVGVTGRTYIISTDNKVIIDEDIVTGMQVGASNHLNKSESHLGLEQRAMTGGDGENGVGFGNYIENGTPHVAGFSPISGTDGWILMSTAQSFEFLDQFQFVFFASVLVSSGLMAIFIYLNIKSTRGFVTPITQCVERISALASGDIHSPVPQIRSNDEAGLLAESTDQIVHSLSIVVQDIESLLGSMASGNFDVESQNPDAYIGDFRPILDSVTTIIQRLNNTMWRISQSSEEVNGAATEVALSSSYIAEGTEKQEASAQELAILLGNISEQVSISTQKANQVRDISLRTGEEVRTGSQRINELVGAMSHISDSAGKIEEIIKGIEDIAFQTNILALNAAVEAARAGSAGRGFAVVADEVRKLSINSSSHVQETAGLVEATVKAVADGTEIAFQTANSMKTVVEEVEEAIQAIQDISDSMEEQSGEIVRISENMEEIVAIIGNTSASTEESASTSEQLSDQASTLRDLISNFKLKS